MENVSKGQMLISNPRESLRLRSIIAATEGGKEEKDRSEYGQGGRGKF